MSQIYPISDSIRSENFLVQRKYTEAKINIHKFKFDFLFFSATLQTQTFEPRHDKSNKVSVRTAKTQIWSESSLCAQWVAKDPSFLHADSEDTDQTGRTLILLVLSCRGSFVADNTTDICLQYNWHLPTKHCK